MRKATRQLLKYLAACSPRAQLVTVKPLFFEKARKNFCYENMMYFLDENEDWVLRSGWLVGEYFGEHGTAILPHFWVHDPTTKVDYDVTPFEETQTFEYVLDIEVAKNGTKNKKGPIPIPLKINSDGSLSARIGKDKFQALERIDYPQLLDLANKYLEVGSLE